ncbi:hypothetical protein JTE90_029149 [Oedothorax gibbosus]|uniref:Secreted protein n=1 Tax=Oedothorax gibbosus TaxID=931172 RepID=A0AAV6UAU5_9ARAC|nr:hypothetical protein JTE90_029149 [Oedothorax gibbosus]
MFWLLSGVRFTGACKKAPKKSIPTVCKGASCLEQLAPPVWGRFPCIEIHQRHDHAWACALEVSNDTPNDVNV